MKGKGKRYWKKKHAKALEQGFKAVELVNTALETMKASASTIAALQAQVETLQTPKKDPFEVDYFQ